MISLNHTWLSSSSPDSGELPLFPVPPPLHHPSQWLLHPPHRPPSDVWHRPLDPAIPNLPHVVPIISHYSLGVHPYPTDDTHAAFLRPMVNLPPPSDLHNPHFLLFYDWQTLKTHPLIISNPNPNHSLSWPPPWPMMAASPSATPPTSRHGHSIAPGIRSPPSTCMITQHLPLCPPPATCWSKREDRVGCVVGIQHNRSHHVVALDNKVYELLGLFQWLRLLLSHRIVCSILTGER